MEEREGRSRESSLPRGLHQHLLRPPEPSMALPALVIGRVDEEARFEARPPRYLPRFPPSVHGQYFGASSPESHIAQEISESSPEPPSYSGGVPCPSSRPTSGPALGLYDYRPQHNIFDNRSQPYTPGFSGNHPPSALRWGIWQEGEAGPSSLSQRHRIGYSAHEPHRHEPIQNRGIAHPVPRASHELPYEDARWPRRPGSTTSSLGLHLGRGSSGPITPPRRTHSLGATPGREEPPAGLFEHNAQRDECEKSKAGEVPLPVWLNQESPPSEDGRKRRRVFKKTPIACRFCRARKLRCNGTRPSCHNCTQRGLDCLYDPVARRRGPGKARKGPKGKPAGPISELTGYKFELEGRDSEEKDGESMEQ